MSDRMQLDRQVFCGALHAAIGQLAPGLAERLTAADIEAWVSERWPLPEVAVLSVPQWARAFLLERLAPGCGGRCTVS